MNFSASRSQGLMSVDNASLKFDVAPFLSADIEMVAWDGDAGSGFVEYNNRARMMEKTTDLASYRAMIDAWIDAAAGSPIWVDPSTESPTPLTIEQARQIKLDMVDALYTNKRLQPRWHGAYQYEASDEAIAHMTVAAGIGQMTSGQTVDDIFAAIVSTFNNNVNTYNNQIWTGALAIQRSNWGTVGVQETDATRPNGTGGPTAGVTHSHGLQDYAQHTSIIGKVNVGGFSYQSAFLGGLAPGAAAVTWQPLNLTYQVGIPSAEFRAALRALISHRSALATRRVTMRNAIAGLSTIGAIVAYDVTFGWPV